MSAGEEIVVGGRSHWDIWHERTEERIVAAYQTAQTAAREGLCPTCRSEASLDQLLMVEYPPDITRGHAERRIVMRCIKCQ